MAQKITIHFRDGSHLEFNHVGRAGGSYTIHGKYEGGFFKVVDEFNKVTAFPSDLISKIEEVPNRW